jgi:dihydrofolate reductase
MRQLTYFIAVTLDGYIATADGDADFFPWAGDHGPAITAEFPESVPAQVRKMIGIDPPNKRFDTVLMGRATYETGLKDGITNPYPHQHQYVVSRTMTHAPDPAIQLVSDAVGTVRALKRDAGMGIWICGGGKLAHELLDEIDELALKLYPIAIGSGIPLFSGGFRLTRFNLANSRVFNDGVALMTYTKSKWNEADVDPNASQPVDP